MLGLAHSRSTDELKRLDLLDKAEVEKTLEEFKPDCELVSRGEKARTITHRSGRGHSFRC